MTKSQGRPIFHYDWVAKLHGVWKAMQHRCDSPRNNSYKNYGGRGITVCAEWRDFNVFCHWALTNGYKPGLECDRQDNDAGYSPDNCRWVDRLTNARNKRPRSSGISGRKVKAWGEVKVAEAWAMDSRCRVDGRTLRHRLDSGWTPERAIAQPSTRGNPICIHGHDKNGRPVCLECHRFREYERNHRDARGMYDKQPGEGDIPL